MGGWLKKELSNIGTGAVNTIKDIPGSVSGFVNNPLQSVEKGVGQFANIYSGGSLHDNFGMSFPEIGGSAAAIMAAIYGGSMLMGGEAGAGGAAGGSTIPFTGADSFSGVAGSSTIPFTGADSFTGAGAGAGAGGGSSWLSSLGWGGGGGGGGGNSWLQNLAGGTSILSGLYGMYQANQLKQMAGNADPFAAYRPQYAQELAQLEADPSKIMQTPGYDAGIQAVQRGMASRGYGGSGNEATALLKYGGDIYNQRVMQLSGLAGANIGPGVGLQAFEGATQLAGQSLGSLGYGTTMLSGWNPNQMYTGSMQ